MNLRESLRLAASSLNNNKLRSLLTLLGIIIGIMAVIIIMTLGAGLQKRVVGSLEGVGATNHLVAIHERSNDESDADDPFASFGYAPPVDERDRVTFDQFEELRNHFGSRVRGVDLPNNLSYMGELSSQVEDISAPSSVYSALPETLSMRNKEVEFGRGITQDDQYQGRPVTVISAPLAQKLFNDDSQAALGQRIDIKVGGQTAAYTIVGVLGDQGNSDMFSDTYASEEAYVPVGSTSRLGQETTSVDSFTVQSNPEEDTALFQAELQSYLNRWYERNEDFEITVVDLSAGFESLTKVFGVISAVLSSIGGISLLVGGIGVMNIMLITVTERTREIGVRKALGATQADIRTQFIVEAILVCLVGGVIGILLGSAIGMSATALFDAFVLPPIGAVLISLFFSLATGVFFGAYPASKAAKMQPVEALRYE